MIAPAPTADAPTRPAPEGVPGDVWDAVTALFRADPDAAYRWMRTPRPFLHGQTPAAAARTAGGAKQVLTLVGRLSHGVFT